MPENQDKLVAAVMERLIEEGPEGMAQIFTALFDIAMRLERERFLGAGLYERSEGAMWLRQRLQGEEG